MRRLLHLATAIGLPVGHAIAQYDAFGFVSDDIAPRFWEREVAAAQEPSLVKRDGACGSGKHPCSDVDSTLCCTNEQYCIVNSTWGVECCALGSSCLSSRCDASHYFANTTIAVTTTLAVVTVETTAAETLTSSKPTTTVTTSSVCSPRSCTSTQYLCASSFGGGCCPYGFDCASSGKCIGTSSTVSASSTSSVSPIAVPIPSGCSAQGQTLCTAGAGISGGGCCDAGYACITVSLSLMCAPTSTSSVSSATATAPGNVTVEHTSANSSLPTGAKTGIAIGVIVAAAVVIGGLTWLFIKRRRRDARSTTTGNEMRSVPPNENNTPGAGAAGAYSDGRGRPHYGPSGRNMSEQSGYAPSSTQVSRDYFRSGPYSDRHGSIAPHNNDDHNDGAENNRTWESGAATAGTPHANEQEYYYQGYNHLPQDDQQVQQQQQQVPHGSDDVLTPVEIGQGGSVKRGRPKMTPTGAGSSDISSNNNDDSRRRGYSRAGSDGAHSELADTSSAPKSGGRNPSYGGQGGSSGTGVRDSIAGRFELYGSEAVGGTGIVGTYLPQPFPTPGSEMSEFGTPSPMSREGEQQYPTRDI